MDKAALRAEALARRAAMSAEARAAASEAATRFALDALGRTPGLVALFMPIGDEIDTLPLSAALHAAGIALALPVVAGRGQPLLFRRWRPDDALAPGVWGIRQPLEAAEAVQPDTLLCPLAAFDRRGGRIGHGAGYYDRSLAALRAQKPIRAIGFAFACQEVAAAPMEPHDERLDLIVTEREAIVAHHDHPRPSTGSG